MEEQKLYVEIEGTRPLLMHSPAGIGVPSSGKKNTSYVPEDEAAAGLYKNASGVICVPGLCILSMLRHAASEHKAKGRGKKMLKGFVYSGLQVDEDMIPLSPQEWIVDARPAVVSRARIMRWRPRFDAWKLAFHITIRDPSVWNATQVRDVLTDGGKYSGLLDFRPLFGTFKVVKVEDVASGKPIA